MLVLKLTEKEWEQIKKCFEKYKGCIESAALQTDPVSVNALCDCYIELIECLANVRDGVLRPILFRFI